MKHTIKIEYPQSLANTLKMSGQEFVSEIKTSSMIKLFELGKVSSGIAAKVLGLTRLDFLDLLAKYKVSAFGNYDTDDLSEDIANA
mgnify:CR=1 FL=1